MKSNDLQLYSSYLMLLGRLRGSSQTLVKTTSASGTGHEPALLLPVNSNNSSSTVCWYSVLWYAVLFCVLSVYSTHRVHYYILYTVRTCSP